MCHVTCPIKYILHRKLTEGVSERSGKLGHNSKFNLRQS